MARLRSSHACGDVLSSVISTKSRTASFQILCGQEYKKISDSASSNTSAHAMNRPRELIAELGSADMFSAKLGGNPFLHQNSAAASYVYFPTGQILSISLFHQNVCWRCKNDIGDSSRLHNGTKSQAIKTKSNSPGFSIHIENTGGACRQVN